MIAWQIYPGCLVHTKETTDRSTNQFIALQVLTETQHGELMANNKMKQRQGDCEDITRSGASNPQATCGPPKLSKWPIKLSTSVN